MNKLRTKFEKKGKNHNFSDNLVSKAPFLRRIVYEKHLHKQVLGPSLCDIRAKK